MTESSRRPKNRMLQIAAIGAVVVALILIFGSVWMGSSARKATEEAVHNVSLFYLDELAERREQVVANNLRSSIENIHIAIGLMDENDLDSMEHLQAYQARMKQLYDLEKFAFVDTNGLIYTSKGTMTDIESYPFDYRNMTGPVVAVKDLESEEKKVIIAIPIDPIEFNGQELVVCFMEIDMDVMLQGVSMKSDENDTTFCNIYSKEGFPLSSKVLGGLASERNLLEAMEHVDFGPGYSREKMAEDFAEGQEGVATFTYDGVQFTMCYVPVEGTDWMLTYLVRESLIAGQIQSVTDGIIRRSILQTLLTALVLLAMFILMALQIRRSSRLIIEKETAETENRIKQEELEQRLELQEKMLQQERTAARLSSMFTALASDYRSVYYVNLDQDRGICYQPDPEVEEPFEKDEEFAYAEAFRHYGEVYVDEAYREGFLEFIEPDKIRAGLEDEDILAYRYLVHHNGQSFYEMLRIAGVRHAEDREDHIVHAVGMGFTDVDREMRESMDKSQALSDALAAAEEASKAKTIFLSNMSHEIRTPMNAIIGLDNIALSDPEIPGKTREHLEKIDNSARHLLNLINDILDMSRIESGRMVLKNEEFSFSSMLEQINTMVSGQCAEKGLRYDCRINGDIDDYYIGDEMKLRQIIINILGNAVKFTPEGGEISFTVERTARYSGKSTLLLTMADTGIGMEQDYLPKIFDSFSQEDSSATSKYGSSGLGLAITKNIVEMMNGQIEVESRKGEGTTFYVTVTLMDAEKKAAVPSDVEVNPHEMSVLVVDDDPVACEHARLVLEKIGIAADVAASGPEAIEAVRLRHARMAPYNLVLVDWKMPEMDGVETTRRIRKITGDESAIIILTAYRWDDVLEEALQAGVDSFLSKPLFASSLIDEFRRALVRKQKPAAGTGARTSLKGRRVLLAEDVPINVEIIRLQLAAKEMEVEHAVNGRVAVEMFAEHPAGYYDAVLMDMRMPEMDGLTATQTIRAMDRPDAKEIPIIALTANAFDDDVQRSLQAGLNAHLSKPVDPEDLFGTLESMIREKKD